MSIRETLIVIKNNKNGFINLCIPFGYGFLLLAAAWPAMILDMAFNTSLFLPNWFLFGLGVVIDAAIIYYIGYLLDRKKKIKLHEYFYRILAVSGFLIACGILYALAYTRIGC